VTLLALDSSAIRVLKAFSDRESEEAYATSYATVGDPLTGKVCGLHMGKVQSYVESGGLAIIQYADWSGVNVTITPTDVPRVYSTDDAGNIAAQFAGGPILT
jgi:hypothetical protein